MSYDKQKVIDIALAEVGYLEKASASQLDDKTANAGSGNYTKYSRDLAKYPFFNGKKQGVAWCAVFCAWCYDKAYGKTAALKLLCQPTKPANNAGAGCKYARNYFKNKGQLHDTPQPGDIIFFYNGDKSQIQHQGIVYKVDSSNVYTVEGNTSSVSGVVANGGAVAKKSYSLNYGRLAGFGRPDWGIATADTSSDTSSTKPDSSSEKTNTSSNTSTTYTTYTVKKGDSLWGISKKLLGKGSKYPQIQKANGLTKNLIRVGQKLKIPKG